LVRARAGRPAIGQLYDGVAPGAQRGQIELPTFGFPRARPLPSDPNRTARRSLERPTRFSSRRAAVTAEQAISQLAEYLRSGRDDRLVRHVVEVLADVPAVPERIIELTVAVAPEHVRKRLSDLSPRRQRPRERRLRIAHGETEDNRGPAQRRRPDHPHLRELVRDVQHAVADPQLDRHESPVGGGNPCDLLCSERVPIEPGGLIGAANDEVRCDGHARNLRRRPRAVLNVPAVSDLRSPACPRQSLSPVAPTLVDSLARCQVQSSANLVREAVRVADLEHVIEEQLRVFITSELFIEKSGPTAALEPELESGLN
jgi:hypothetical protein